MRKIYFIKMLALLLPLQIFSQTSVSQLTVTPDSVATTLAQAIEGSGVTISSASLNCGAGGAGTFSYPSTGTNLGLTNGILLTNGGANIVANAGSYFCSVQTGNNFTDTDLTAIYTSDTNDVCILQFDIIPMGDTMSIKYVFGSEEYNGYVCSPFNDAFGFFLTGLNPAGGTYNGQNIAILPGITPATPVSINTVNNGGTMYPCSATNPSFYHDNIASPNNDIAYDGYTIPITSVIPVVASATYHIKIAIADASDEIFDSGVFIQDGISSNQPNTTNINLLNKQDKTLLVYPNPTNGILTIKYTLNNTDCNEAVLQLLEMNSGTTILKKNIACNATQTQIDMSELPSGVYSLSILSNTNASKNIKVIKVK